MLTTKEVAELLNVSQKTVRNLIDSGKISAFKFGRDYRIHEEDLKEFISQSRIEKTE